jgi:hypothetical protein
MFFRESVGYSWSPACHATLRKVDCHLYGRAVLGQASFMLGRRGRSLGRCPASRDGVVADADVQRRHRPVGQRDEVAPGPRR